MTNLDLQNEILDIKIKLNELMSLISLQFENISPKPTTCKYTLFEWLDEWYTVYKVPKLKASGLREIKNCIDKHIKNNFSDIPLNELKALDIQKNIAKIKTSRMRKYTYDTLGAALTQAYKIDLIQENIFSKTDKVTHQRKNGKALTIEQQNEFLRIIKDCKYKTLYEFYLLSGCRKSEALSLKWSDIDFIKKRIHIAGTKTQKSDRYIPLFPQIEVLLTNIIKDTEFVFNADKEAFKTHFRRLKEHYNLKFRLHDLRHTFATRCAESGISINTVQKWLGHAQASTTANIYTHVSTPFEIEETKKLKIL